MVSTECLVAGASKLYRISAEFTIDNMHLYVYYIV